MRSKAILVAVLVFSFGQIGFATTPSFQGLGDLAGGAFNSIALGVSADGSIVVGWSSIASGNEAFHWTSGGGMVGLGDSTRQ